MLILAGLAQSAPVQLETTYPRDNAVCYVNGQRLELFIRGTEKSIEPADLGYGQHILYKKNGFLYSLPLSSPRTDTFRFMKGDNQTCSRIKGFDVGENLALLFLKENGASLQKLVIQLIHKNSLIPKDVIETAYLTNDAVPIKDGFAFVSHSDKDDLDSGSVMIEGQKYSYQDRKLSVWVSYTTKGFKIVPEITYANFPWKSFYKDQVEFLQATGWDQKQESFQNPTIYVAVNHKLKRECLHLSPGRKKISGAEDWRCRQRI